MILTLNIMNDFVAYRITMVNVWALCLVTVTVSPVPLSCTTLTEFEILTFYFHQTASDFFCVARYQAKLINLLMNLKREEKMEGGRERGRREGRKEK